MICKKTLKRLAFHQIDAFSGDKKLLSGGKAFVLNKKGLSCYFIQDYY